LTSAFFRVASAEALRRSRPGDCPKKRLEFTWENGGFNEKYCEVEISWGHHQEITKN
jgi:hypothetical protein